MSEEILINGKKITELSDMFFEYCKLKKETERLQKENEKLKARLKTLDDEVLTIEITPDEFERCKEYKQALEEIREISKQCMTKDLCSIDCDYADRCYIEDEEVPTYDICKLIIEKINEAFGNE